MMSAKHRPLVSRLARVAGVTALALLLLILLTVSRTPSVDANAPTSPQMVEAAKEAMRRDQATLLTAREHQVLRFTDSSFKAALALGGRTIGVERISGSISSGELTVRTSLPLPAGLWLNASAATSGESSGFPPLRLKIGRISLPPWLSRPVANIGHFLLRLQGWELAPLDRMVSAVVVTNDRVTARVDVVATSRIARTFFEPVPAGNSEIVANILCGLARMQDRAPTSRFDVQVQRAFAAAPTTEAATYNRSALTALAMFTMGRRATALDQKAARKTRSCAKYIPFLLLRGRADLAKHWALSAGLRATYGARIASSLGEWKELSDSRPAGSGFSFVDLAADRAGILIADRAVDTRTADGLARKLKIAGEDWLLPLSLLAAEEGLSEIDFLKRYGHVDTAEYGAATKRIDRALQRALPQ